MAETKRGDEEYDFVETNSKITDSLNESDEMWLVRSPADVDLRSAIESGDVRLAFDMTVANDVGAVVGSFRWKGRHFNAIAGNISEASQIVNAFPNGKKNGSYEIGRPFVRHINIVEDVASNLLSKLSEEDAPPSTICTYNYHVPQKRGLKVRFRPVGCSKHDDSSKKKRTHSACESEMRASPSKEKKRKKKKKRSQ